MSRRVHTMRCSENHAEIEFVVENYESPRHVPCPLCELRGRVCKLEVMLRDVFEAVANLKKDRAAVVRAWRILGAAEEVERAVEKASNEDVMTGDDGDDVPL